MSAAVDAKKIDTLSFIMEVESTGFDHTNQDHIDALQDMIDTGLIWRLQGSWQRFANSMIKAGVVRHKNA